jgi:hypothetical protein
VENCGNTLILRSASENGGTARFASKLIGEPAEFHSLLLILKPGYCPRESTLADAVGA